MKSESVLAELNYCDKELEKQERMKRLRRLLRIFLIGFFLGRDSDKKIVQLKAQRDSVIRRIIERLAEIETTNTQIKEIRNSSTLLNETEQRQWFSRLVSLENYFASFREYLPQGIAEKYATLLSESFENILIQWKEIVCAEISRLIFNDTYLTFQEKLRLESILTLFQDYLKYCDLKGLISAKSFQIAQQDLALNRKFVDNYNNSFLERKKKQYSHLFKKDSLVLDEDQKKAVLIDDKHNLVVAAAGSGKTEVLITRIAYLVQRNPDGVKPERILAIAFQNQAVEEIR
jgi:hypothetical protein